MAKRETALKAKIAGLRRPAVLPHLEPGFKSKMRIFLFLSMPAKAAGPDSESSGEHAGQMGLIRKSAFHGDLDDGHPCLAKKILGAVDPLRHQPAMWRHPHGPLERTSKMASGKPAKRGKV